ncbi:hypothetical protein P280DRAFT_513968 [Massarina eburnea CBS 473.64]|uniref:Uncharacterized protein n=1 Tax=Massarina eburnea CBS 473.64 TaxID=1395130 RepID=A0A6A6SBA8_9PLEO|nr:hypothetical protein P280DRAFT_513968 [Massarina eburnea CBS 473.64]
MQASTIASPVPHVLMRKGRLPVNPDGRATPLPQYQETQPGPFTLILQEEKDNPGQFQLVVNIPLSSQTASDGKSLQPAASNKLIASLKEVLGLGYDVSPLYHMQKSSPPSSPHEEKEWSDLDAIPPEFLNKVVPDWKVTFSRSDSTVSSQSRKLADIKARIKKSGKGFVVRLLKGSNAETGTDEVAEVHLGQGAPLSPQYAPAPAFQERPIELDAGTAIASPTANTPINAQPKVYELDARAGRSVSLPVEARPSPVPNWLQQVMEPSPRSSIVEEGSFSDAETLLPDVRSVIGRSGDRTDIESVFMHSSTMPTRSNSVFSFVKTPTRGLSVVGPVRRIEKPNRLRVRGKAARSDLNRSGANKSMRRHSPRTSTHNVPTISVSASSRDDTRPSAEHPTQPSSKSSKSRLRLQTDVPRTSSANTSPITRRNRSPRANKPKSPSSLVDQQVGTSPVWSEADPSEELREALDKAFGRVNGTDGNHDQPSRTIPRTIKPVSDVGVGDISLPPELEIRMPPSTTRSSMATFWGLALSALSETAFGALQALRAKYGSEPQVASNHVRVRWTCSCGEPLYDDFIERQPGAARLLEAYPSTRTSTTTSMSSLFDTNSLASTLTTPASTYGGPSSWGKHSNGAIKHSSSRLRNNSPFSVRIGTHADESWLLTCANEGRFTPKIVHVDVNAGKIKCDKDLALALREHYERINRRWLKWARLRGLSTIEFVQFEVHRNRFADIRAAPSMPPTSSSPTATSASSGKASPSQHPYTFEPVDLIPPVGSTYLLHLFKHPEDYDGELVTYLRAPKRRERLDFGMGWGINLVEGFLAQKIWAVFMMVFGVGSAVFAVVWAVKKRDIQGAFGVASWVVTLTGLAVGGIQAWLE